MSSRAGLSVIVALTVAIVGAGIPSLARAGYTPDEEFTLFAVRGIQGHGLPLLPSGLLYDRGLAYSYAAWLSTALTGRELPAFRLLSLLSSAGTLLVGYALIRRVSVAAGLTAVALASSGLSFWAAATTGRFYAPFVLASIGTVLATVRATATGPLAIRGSVAIAALAFLARLTHELAFTLLIVPIAGALLVAAEPRHAEASEPPWRTWLLSGVVLSAGLVLAQAALLVLHFVQPPQDAGGGAMIQRFFLWQVLNLFEVPRGGPAGVILVVVLVSWLIVPARAARAARLGSSALLLALAPGIVLEASSHGLAGAVRRVVPAAFVYPLDMGWHLAAVHPVLLATALSLLVLRLRGAGGAWPPAERAAHLAWVGWVVWFGVIESGITLNYVLLPTSCALAAIGIDLAAIGQHLAAIRPGRLAQLGRAGLVGVGLLVAADQWRGTGPLSSRLAAARPTIDIPGIDTVRATLQPADRVACTDELACLLLVGRVDAWLALDDYVRERFVVVRGAGPSGVYAGAPAAFTLSPLVSSPSDAPSHGRVVVVDVFKEYPVGNSRAWLPRALEAEGLASEAWLTTAQARVLRLSRSHPRGPD